MKDLIRSTMRPPALATWTRSYGAHTAARALATGRDHDGRNVIFCPPHRVNALRPKRPL